MFADRDSLPTDPTIPDGRAPNLIPRRQFLKSGLESGLKIGGTITVLTGLVNAEKIGEGIGKRVQVLLNGPELIDAPLRMPAVHLAENDVIWEEFRYPSFDQQERAMHFANAAKSAVVIGMHSDIALQVLDKDTQRWDEREGYKSYQPRLDHSESLLSALRNIVLSEDKGGEATGFECVYRNIDFGRVGLPNRGMVEVSVSGNGLSELMNYTIRVNLLDSKLKRKMLRPDRDLNEIGRIVWNRARRIFNLHPKINSMFVYGNLYQELSSDNVVVFPFDFVGEMLASGEESPLAVLQELNGRTLMLSTDSYGDKFQLQVNNPSQRIKPTPAPTLPLPVNIPKSKEV